MNDKKYEKAVFSIEGFGPFGGYRIPGALWNGFEVPFFDKATADRIAKAAKEQGVDLRYSSKKDAYVEKGSETLCYEAVSAQTPQGTIKLYPIGAECWTWELGDATEQEGK